MEKNYFTELNSVNVNDKVEKKSNLSYLSWAYAWGEVKKRYPDTNYKIYERDTEFGPVNYFTDGRTGWVKTSVTVNGIEHVEELPIMDNRNNPIFYDAITSTDVNKTIQRSLTKAIARHGLGLYIYAGEDIPDGEESTREEEIEQGKEIAKEASRAAGNEAPAPTVGKDAVVPTTAPSGASVAELNKLVKAIGTYAKKIKQVYGNLEPYQAIVLQVTGNTAFKCNVATEEDIPLLEAILAELKKDPEASITCMANKKPTSCSACGKKILNGLVYTHNGKAFCYECYQKMQQELAVAEEQKQQLFNYIKQLFSLGELPPDTVNVVEKELSKEKTIQEIHDVLYYYYEIMARPRGSLNAIPFVLKEQYENAMKYFKEAAKLKEINEGIDLSNPTAVTITMSREDLSNPARKRKLKYDISDL